MKLHTKNKTVPIGIKLGVFFMFLVCSIFATHATNWADENQLFRQQINITGATSPLTNYTSTIIINASNIGPDFDFTTMRDSLRFYFQNTTITIPLGHYVQSWDTGNQNASLLLETPYFDATQDATLWMYYGDTSKTNIENYCSVFLFCEQFTGPTLNPKLLTTDQDTVSGTSFSQGGGELSIGAGGADTWVGSDEYGSVFVEDIEGNVEVRLTVNSLSNSNAWAKSGIMFKNDMTQSSTSLGYVFNVVTPGNGYSFQSDPDNNGFLSTSSTTDTASYPSHLRIIKTGTNFEGYYSKISQNVWTPTANNIISSTNTIQDIGISLTSHAGTTLATSTYDNFTIRRYTTDTITTSFGIQEKKANYLNSTVLTPSTATTTNFKQNETINVVLNVSCLGIDSSSSCGNVSAQLYHNTSNPTALTTTPGSTPAWITSNNVQSCILGFNTSCVLNWTINITQDYYSPFEIFSVIQSNNSDIENTNSSAFSIQTIKGSSVSINDSYFNFGTFLKNSGDKTSSFTVLADNGNNTNITLTCVGGNCSQFSTTWTQGSSLNQGQQTPFDITCSDTTSGNFTATYHLTSNEFEATSNIVVECVVEPIFGPIIGTLTSPLSGSTTSVSQNSTFTLEANLNCTGFCGNITANAFLLDPLWWNQSWKYKQNISVLVNDPIPANYQILLQLDSTEIGSSFNWNNACKDVRILESGTPLQYWIENCNSTTQELDVWVKTTNSYTSGEALILDFYYGNEQATSISNASQTFRSDEIHLVSGRCPTSNGACSYLDNVADGETIRANIGTTNWGIDGQAYVNQINYPSNPFGTDDNYYMRFRTLFIPKTSGSYTFGTASDDGSNAGLWSGDGYGFGLSTPSSLTSSQDIVTNWYGGHASGTCGFSAAIERTRSLQAQKGYWIDYVMQEYAGGQDAQFCINRGGGFFNLGSAAFSGEFFAREYVENEPSITNIGTEQSQIIPTSPATPLFTTSAQNQNCIPSEDGTCTFQWTINATGSINTSYNISVLFSSNYSFIDSSRPNPTTITITNDIINISLLNPLNQSKIITGEEITFIWNIEHPNQFVNATLFVNSNPQGTQECEKQTNCSKNLNLTAGDYSWYIQGNNSGTLFTSSTYEFRVIEDYNVSISKKIFSQSTNMYGVEITTSTPLTQNFSIYDKVNSHFTAGSFSPLYTTIDTFTTFDLLKWNDISNSTYSLGINSQNASLRDEFIIGLE